MSVVPVESNFCGRLFRWVLHHMGVVPGGRNSRWDVLFFVLSGWFAKGDTILCIIDTFTNTLCINMATINIKRLKNRKVSTYLARYKRKYSSYVFIVSWWRFLQLASPSNFKDNPSILIFHLSLTNVLQSSNINFLIPYNIINQI
jgi:hypothetical protein